MDGEEDINDLIRKDDTRLAPFTAPSPKPMKVVNLVVKSSPFSCRKTRRLSRPSSLAPFPPTPLNLSSATAAVPTIPVGIAGLLFYEGREYSVPMATTKGCLLASTNSRGKATYASGGATSILLKDGMTRHLVRRFQMAPVIHDLLVHYKNAEYYIGNVDPTRYSYYDLLKDVYETEDVIDVYVIGVEAVPQMVVNPSTVDPPILNLPTGSRLCHTDLSRTIRSHVSTTSIGHDVVELREGQVQAVDSNLNVSHDVRSVDAHVKEQGKDDEREIRI
ncbi:hypothetical protein RJ639_046020 [Escallonia herrerae]|uniref:Uncharacterized protein n=1 Tax=Escallonia herrerae TaxID=1293975 RepID=A0AA88W403_9ASTE|nr:hypothetical protein RJ639_046020 [Escallonia herrerae]